MEADTHAYTVEEAGKETKLGRTTIYAELRSGNLIGRKVGRRTIILAEDLQAYLRGLPKTGAAA